MNKTDINIIRYQFQNCLNSIANSQSLNFYSNVKRFVDYIQRTEFLMQYIFSLPQTDDDMDIIIPEIIRLNGAEVYTFGNTDEKIIVNTYKFLSSPQLNEGNIFDICLFYSHTGSFDGMKRFFYDGIISPFASLLLQHIGTALITMGEDVPAPNITVNGGQFNYAQGHSTISAVQNINGINPEQLQTMINEILSIAKEQKIPNESIQQLSESLELVKEELQKASPKKTAVRLILDGLLSTSTILGTIPTIASKINDFSQYIAPLLN